MSAWAPTVKFVFSSDSAIVFTCYYAHPSSAGTLFGIMLLTLCLVLLAI